jgi:hypothetical protein
LARGQETVTTKGFAAIEISRHYLTILCKQGVLIRIGRGCRAAPI